MSGIRHRLVVCYDIRDPVRLRRTHATMMGYGDPIQYSVFVCDLSGTESTLMEAALIRVIRQSVDSVVVVDMGPSAGVAKLRIRTIGTGMLTRQPRYHVI
jgi:CRISPR-associated protein Cas2